MINVKTDAKLKKKAQMVARDLGLPLGTIINRFLHEFVIEQRVVFQRPEVPNAETRKILDRVRREFLADNRSNLSPSFSTAEEMQEWLDKNL